MYVFSIQVEHRIDIEQFDSDEVDDCNDGLNVALYVAQSRFKRNRQLMKEILSETAVPVDDNDNDNNNNNNNLDILRKQVDWLEQRQHQVEADVKRMEEAFSQKKRLFRDSFDAFNAELEVQRSKVVVDDAKYKEMVAKQVEALRAEQRPPPPLDGPMDWQVFLKGSKCTCKCKCGPCAANYQANAK